MVIGTLEELSKHEKLDGSVRRTLRAFPLARAPKHLGDREIMAENDSGLVDENGNRVDWIEIQMSAQTSLILRILLSLIIGQTPRNGPFPSNPWHLEPFLSSLHLEKIERRIRMPCTNFSLSNQGEYLALIDKTEGQPIHEMTRPFHLSNRMSPSVCQLTGEWGNLGHASPSRGDTLAKANASAVLGRLSKSDSIRSVASNHKPSELSLELEEATARIRYHRWIDPDRGTWKPL